MGKFTITLPDIGEGIAEAELTEWNVKVGDVVQEDDVLGTVMTDKAAIEVPTTVSGKVAWLCGEPGDTIAIGAKFIEIEVDGEGNDAPEPVAVAERVAVEVTPVASVGRRASLEPDQPRNVTPRPVPPKRIYASGERVLAAPTVRLRAKEAGIDLRLVPGSGPAGRIGHEDLDAYIRGEAAAPAAAGRVPATETHDVKVVGLRRKIAEKMALSKSRIPHITIIEEVDVEALEELRAKLNGKRDEGERLTLLPFLMRAVVEAVADHPEVNATYDDEAGVVTQFDAVHIGIATHTPAGLTVPVVRHAEAQTLGASAAEIARLANAAKLGKAALEDLGGSTITISSLGPLGAVASTPIINHPEVAIIGVNKIAVRPHWDGQAFRPRRMMNLSCAFDHRVIDGWNAAKFVASLKSLLETPAMLFVED